MGKTAWEQSLETLSLDCRLVSSKIPLHPSVCKQFFVFQVHFVHSICSTQLTGCPCKGSDAISAQEDASSPQGLVSSPGCILWGEPQCFINGLHLNCLTEALKIVIKVIYIPIYVTGHLYQADQTSEDCIPQKQVKAAGLELHCWSYRGTWLSQVWSRCCPSQECKFLSVVLRLEFKLFGPEKASSPL